MRIPKNVLAISIVANHDDGCRYPINTVRLERDKDGHPVAVAVDGKRLITATWKNKGEDPELEKLRLPVTVPVGKWESVANAIASNENCNVKSVAVADTPISHSGEYAISLGTPNGSTVCVFKPVMEKYPPWRDCLPDTEKNEYVHFRVDPVLLAETLIAISKITHSRECGTYFVDIRVPADGSKAIEIRASGDGIDTIGVVMPLSKKTSEYYHY